MSEVTAFDYTLDGIDGNPIALSDWRGQVLLVVNTASQCGFTPQYQGLEVLQQRFKALGFSVIACPCNQFGAQEPGSNEEIAQFCSGRFNVSFPVSAKLEVNGEGAHPLFAHLCAAAPGVLGTESIKWNFTKFLVNRDGKVVDRFAPTTKPEDLAEKIEQLL